VFVEGIIEFVDEDISSFEEDKKGIDEHPLKSKIIIKYILFFLFIRNTPPQFYCSDKSF